MLTQAQRWGQQHALQALGLLKQADYSAGQLETMQQHWPQVFTARPPAGVTVPENWGAMTPTDRMQTLMRARATAAPGPEFSRALDAINQQHRAIGVEPSRGAPRMGWYASGGPTGEAPVSVRGGPVAEEPFRSRLSERGEFLQRFTQGPGEPLPPPVERLAPFRADLPSSKPQPYPRHVGLMPLDPRTTAEHLTNIGTGNVLEGTGAAAATKAEEFVAPATSRLKSLGKLVARGIPK